MEPVEPNVPFGSSRMINIPLDIIHSIVHHVRNDPSTLKQWSTISRSFLIPCRKHLFSTIHLSHGEDPPSPSPCTRLYETLHHNPQLVHNIRTLHVANDADWTLKDPSFPKLMGIIADQGTLREFSFNMRGCGSTHWPTSFPDTHQSAVYNLLGTTGLETVRFYNFCLLFPIEAIGACPSLRRLEYFGDISCHQTVDHARPADLSYVLPSSTPGTQRPAIKSLSFNDATSQRLEKYLCSEVCPLDITQLRSLSVHGSSDASFLAAQTLTTASSDTLIALSWKFPWSSRGVAPLERGMALVNINHHHLSQLHTLSFNVEVTQIKAVEVMLREYGLPDSVKELVVEIRYIPSLFLSMRPDHVPYVLRTELSKAEADATLASHVSKGSPRVRIRIHVNHPTWSASTQTSVQEDIGFHLESMFPLVRAAGLLITEWEDDADE